MLRGLRRGLFGQLGLQDRQRNRPGKSVFCQDDLRLEGDFPGFTDSYDFAFGKPRRLVRKLQLYILSRRRGFPGRLLWHIEVKKVCRCASAAVPKLESRWLENRKENHTLLEQLSHGILSDKLLD